MSITLKRATTESLDEIVEAVSVWQQDGRPVQHHPGDTGWNWSLGVKEVAEAVRVWRRDGQILAVGMVGSSGLIRMGIALRRRSRRRVRRPVTDRWFASAILPAWSRKSPRAAEVLPLLYLHGLATSDFAPAPEQFLGSDAGLSAATINRLTTQWQDEARSFNGRSLAETDYVYRWVDGIHLKVRLEQDKVCLW